MRKSVAATIAGAALSVAAIVPLTAGAADAATTTATSCVHIVKPMIITHVGIPVTKLPVPVQNTCDKTVRFRLAGTDGRSRVLTLGAKKYAKPVVLAGRAAKVVPA